MNTWQLYTLIDKVCCDLGQFKHHSSRQMLIWAMLGAFGTKGFRSSTTVPSRKIGKYLQGNLFFFFFLPLRISNLYLKVGAARVVVKFLQPGDSWLAESTTLLCWSVLVLRSLLVSPTYEEHGVWDVW